MSKNLINTVILSGGSGSRLWPLSRADNPKQFVKIFGDNSLLDLTINRFLDFSNRILIVSNYAYKDHLEIFIVDDCVSAILERESKNTAFSIYAALEWFQDSDLIIVTPSDHNIENNPEFSRAVQEGIELANKGRLVTFGITPKYPATGYGYFLSEDFKVGGISNNVKCEEKPSQSRAEELLETKSVLWNAGIFLAKKSTFIELFTENYPEINQVSLVLEELKENKLFVINTNYDFIKDLSFDKAVLELTDKLSVVPVDCGWSDLGSWDELFNIWKKTGYSHAAIEHNSRNCDVYSPKAPVVLNGVSDLIVINLQDVLLVADKNQPQSIKNLYNFLIKSSPELTRSHSLVSRPWGEFEILGLADRYKVKRLTVYPGHSISLQLHHHRAEHWVVVRGTASITQGDHSNILTENQSVYIPIGQKHMLSNPGNINVEIIEVQTGSYLGEDDIVRLKDGYGRI
jgi:mannose-1-phosphate guanylyltransferase/mannose-6-phosphate isomerase